MPECTRVGHSLLAPPGTRFFALRGGGQAMSAEGDAITEEQAGEELIKAAVRAPEGASVGMGLSRVSAGRVLLLQVVQFVVLSRTRRAKKKLMLRLRCRSRQISKGLTPQG